MRAQRAFLQPGDRVGLVSPSGPAPQEKVAAAVALLRGWGLEPVVGEHALARHPRAAYLAGSDRQRAADLQTAWTDESLRAVFCIRGGYGTVRLLDLLDVPALRAATPKLLIGSSDVTGLHEFWREHLNLPTLFAPMIATDAVLAQPASAEALRRALMEAVTGLTLAGPDATALVPGTAHGVLTGGNLSLLAMTAGAPAPGPRAHGKIVLLEDVTEEPYKLDGLLHTLLRSGYFEGVAGIALGTWEQCGELADVRALVGEVLVPLGVPLVWGLRFGHGPDVASLPLGLPATLYADEKARLTLD